MLSWTGWLHCRVAIASSVTIFHLKSIHFFHLATAIAFALQCHNVYGIFIMKMIFFSALRTLAAKYCVHSLAIHSFMCNRSSVSYFFIQKSQKSGNLEMRTKKKKIYNILIPESEFKPSHSYTYFEKIFQQWCILHHRHRFGSTNLIWKVELNFSLRNNPLENLNAIHQTDMSLY